MKEITCRNCGAAYSEDTESCPYCGTMNKKGAYRGFQQRVAGMIDRMLGLKQEAEKSVSRMILTALVRSLIIVAVIVLAAYLFSLTVNVNYNNDYDADSKTLANIQWYDEHINSIEEAFENGDLKTLKKLYYENTSVVSRWIHYPDFILLSEFEEIRSYQRFSSYQMQKVLYYLFWPEYYTGRNRMKSANTEKYTQMRQQVLEIIEEQGYSEDQLKTIYEKCSDHSGYIDIDALKEYVEGD